VLGELVYADLEPTQEGMSVVYCFFNFPLPSLIITGIFRIFRSKLSTGYLYFVERTMHL